MRIAVFSLGLLVGALLSAGIIKASKPPVDVVLNQLEQERQYSNLLEEKAKQAFWEQAQMRLSVRDLKGEIK